MAQRIERVTIMKKTFLLLAFLLPLLSCESPSDVSNDPEIDIVEINIGKSFDIQLDANWSTGYHWSWTNSESITIVDTTEVKFISDDPNLDGSPGKEMWTFKAKSVGTDTLVFAYQRNKNDVEKTKKIKVVVN